ncbi:MAG: DNA-protecting protein DprA [Candidatus Vogelbacteria bacterium]|nr:DNA-protecting protein DprA [Candidatus Vogelbacteria bacterium]
MAQIEILLPSDYPPYLAEIPEPPTKLFIEGNLPGPDYHLLTVVGSRKFSQYGREACEKLITGLRGYPVAIVSGLALGIDTIAHQAALKAKLPTIAFPGSGLDRKVLHPHSNRRLADEIVAAGGALVAEFPPTMPAGLHTFPKRNRLMAGLAEATLVIEAGEKSGTLITARLALDYNREVLAIPGSIFSPSTLGTNELIRRGATVVTKSEHILDVFDLVQVGVVSQPTLFEKVSDKEKIILELLAIEPLPRDEVIARSLLTISEANTTLAMLEIKGVIMESLGEIRLM